jgi:N-acetyltransferase 10
VRQTPNDLTGEHTAIMVRPLSSGGVVDTSWLKALSADFGRRLISLFSFAFRHFDPFLALTLMENSRCEAVSASRGTTSLDARELRVSLSPHDLKRLDSYAKNLVRSGCDAGVGVQVPI